MRIQLFVVIHVFKPIIFKELVLKLKNIPKEKKATTKSKRLVVFRNSGSRNRRCGNHRKHHKQK